MADRARRSYTFWWMMQRFTGVVLVITLLYHMFAMHFSLSGGFSRSHLNAQAILERLNDPVFQVFYLLFLFSGLVHGLNGAYNLVDDYVRSPMWRMLWVWALWFIGLLVFFWGAITILT